MTHQHTHLPDLKAFIDELGGNWPSVPDDEISQSGGVREDHFEGPDAFIVWTYNNASTWDEFIENVKDHCKSIIEICEKN